MVCYDPAPVFQFRDYEDLKSAIAFFYESRKPTAALCPAPALLDVRLSDGTHLIEGRTMTGFASVEEDFSDAAVGQKVMPFQIEDEAKARNANYVQVGLLKALQYAT